MLLVAPIAPEAASLAAYISRQLFLEFPGDAAAALSAAEQQKLIRCGLPQHCSWLTITTKYYSQRVLCVSPRAETDIATDAGYAAGILVAATSEFDQAAAQTLFAKNVHGTRLLIVEKCLLGDKKRADLWAWATDNDIELICPFVRDDEDQKVEKDDDDATTVAGDNDKTASDPSVRDDAYVHGTNLLENDDDSWNSMKAIYNSLMCTVWNTDDACENTQRSNENRAAEEESHDEDDSATDKRYDDLSVEEFESIMAEVARAAEQARSLSDVERRERACVVAERLFRVLKLNPDG